MWLYEYTKERTGCLQTNILYSSFMHYFINSWMWVSFINKEINNILNNKLIWLNDVDGVDQQPEAWHSLLPLHWSYFIHNVTQLWCCFMSDDGVRLHVEASVDSVSFSLVFEKMCTSAPYRITMKTRIPNCFIQVVLLSLRSFRLVYHQVQMKAVLFPDVCVCEGSVGHESSSEELEGDRDRSAGHSGGLFSHHLVSDPPHSRYCSKHSFMFTNIHFWDGKVSFNEKGILLKPHVVNHGILTRLISLNHLYSSFI